MSSSKFELLCIITMGIGQMFMMTGFNTQSFVVESVLHSVSSRHSDVIDSHAGYYGPSVMYLVYTFSNLVAPSILHLFGAKWTLVCGSFLLTLYYSAFFVLSSHVFYVASGLMGLGFALFYAGQGTYMTSHSSMRTISRNSVLVWTVCSVCMLLGGGILALIFFFGATPPPVVEALNGTAAQSTEDSKFYRQFSEHEVTILFAVFTSIGLLSTLVFSCLPRSPITDPLSSEADCKWEGLKTHLYEQLSTCIEPKVLLVAPLFMHWGMYTSFWTGVYPTTLTFTQSLTSNLYLLPVFAVCVGLGEIGVGLIVTSLSHRYPSFGLRPTMILACVISAAAFMLIAVSTPSLSSIQPNNEEAWLLQPSMVTVCCISFLLGSADACLSTVRGVICALVIPHRRSHVFSSAKFYQSLSGCLIFFFSPRLGVYPYLIVMSSSLFIALIGFWIVTHWTKISPSDVIEPAKLGDA